MFWLLLLALGLIVLGWLALGRATSLRQGSGLPGGKLVYADAATDAWQINDKPLYSATYRLTGKPDYLVQTERGPIPVEVKSTNAPAVPYLGHLLQLAAYCLLVEESTGQSPPYGLLKYADALYEVDFSQELREELLDTMAEMRQAYLARTVHRHHEQPAKCQACGFFEVCDEALA